MRRAENLKAMNAVFGVMPVSPGRLAANVLQLGAVCVGLRVDNCAKLLLCWCVSPCVGQFVLFKI